MITGKAHKDHNRRNRYNLVLSQLAKDCEVHVQGEVIPISINVVLSKHTEFIVYCDKRPKRKRLFKLTKRKCARLGPNFRLSSSSF